MSVCKLNSDRFILKEFARKLLQLVSEMFLCEQQCPEHF